MSLIRTYLAKALAFLRVHGLEVVTTYVGTLVTLVISHTSSLNTGAILALFGAAALTVAKQFNAPAWVVSLLQKLESTVAPSSSSVNNGK